MHEIFHEHLATDAAQAQLTQLIDLIRAGKRVCILCFEADPAKCHRRLVARAVSAKTKWQVVDLIPGAAGRPIPD